VPLVDTQNILTHKLVTEAVPRLSAGIGWGTECALNALQTKRLCRREVT
jgi:hypothetical protein